MPNLHAPYLHRVRVAIAEIPASPIEEHVAQALVEGADAEYAGGEVTPVPECAFCVVPYVRGRERSVPARDILREVHRLAARGIKEIVLLGQTVNAYHYGPVGFGELLRMVAAVDGITRIRFTSPHPCDISPGVIEAMAEEPKIQPYLHLPVQSGSDRILAAMGRGYTTDEYLRLLERLRTAIPSLFSQENTAFRSTVRPVTGSVAAPELKPTC